MIRYQLINVYSFPKILLLFWCFAVCHLGYAQNIQIYTNKPQSSSVENKAKAASDKVEKKIIEKTQSFSDSLKLKKKEKKLREALKVAQAADSIRKLQDKEKALRQEAKKRAKEWDKTSKVANKIDSLQYLPNIAIEKASQKIKGVNKISNFFQQKRFSKTFKDSLKIGERLYLGGDFGWSFGQTEIFLNVSPLIGYRASEKFSVGAGFMFQYWRAQVIFIDLNRGLNYSEKITTLFYGGRAFARLTLFKGLFANTEAEIVNRGNFDREGNTIRQWVPVMWAGFGYKINISSVAAINIIGLYNPIYDPNKTPYRSPFDLRMGLQFK
jgi:hypothetical protein